MPYTRIDRAAIGKVGHQVPIMAADADTAFISGEGAVGAIQNLEGGCCNEHGPHGLACFQKNGSQQHDGQQCGTDTGEGGGLYCGSSEHGGNQQAARPVGEGSAPIANQFLVEQICPVISEYSDRRGTIIHLRLEFFVTTNRSKFNHKKWLRDMHLVAAVILAAGRGTRLGADVPKGLIELGGQSLVARSVRQLQARGIRNIWIVTGHKRDAYETFALAHDGVACVHNAEYERLGSLESLRCALQMVSGPILVLDADIIYESRGLDALIGHSAENSVLVSDCSGSGDDNYVWTDEQDRISLFSKVIHDHPGQPSGEHIGIIKIGDSLRAAIGDMASAYLHAHPEASYEAFLNGILTEHSIAASYCRDMVWAEIDNQSMYEAALNVTLPKLIRLGDQVV